MSITYLYYIYTGWTHSTETNNTKHAFIKSQYPHREDQWSWGKSAGQTIYIIQKPRTTLQIYMFLLHEISYSNNWFTFFTHIKENFFKRHPCRNGNILKASGSSVR